MALAKSVPPSPPSSNGFGSLHQAYGKYVLTIQGHILAPVYRIDFTTEVAVPEVAAFGNKPDFSAFVKTDRICFAKMPFLLLFCPGAGYGYIHGESVPPGTYPHLKEISVYLWGSQKGSSG